MKTGLMIDSGAFSVLHSGTEISLEEYMDFIRENDDVIDHYIVLDVIGDVEASWKNQKIMEKNGLHPLPVFHMWDGDFKYLDRCLEYDYFCLGGMAKGFTKQQRCSFMDRCFSTICGADGVPKRKVHGLGVTDFDLMFRYPWYSVDSSKWCIEARNGRIMIPKRTYRGTTVADFDVIPVSEEAPERKLAGSDHIDRLPAKRREWVLEHIAEMGFNLKELATDHKKRNEFNLLFFLNLEARQDLFCTKFSNMEKTLI